MTVHRNTSANANAKIEHVRSIANDTYQYPRKIS